MANEQPVAKITGYHAHVYYDPATKPLAAQLREAIEQRFAVTVGRWHDAPIGPHPCGSYQIAFASELFGELIPWLALHRRGLTIFVHPETEDAIADHSAHVIWLGESRNLDLSALRCAPRRA
ncbi:MAG: DOPA 4,5-dioxygenase family protein [Geminicoccaceae bacterium]